MIDTSVEGTVSAVSGLATWLRDTLQANLTEGADLSAAGRRVAGREWDGKDADAYSDYARHVVNVTDEHAARVGRAAGACDRYAVRLKAMKTTMSGIRDRAVAGDLSVSGDTINEPPEVEATVVEPGSPEETAYNAAVAKIELYNELSTDTTAAWTSFDEWIQANLVTEIADADDTGGADGLLATIKDSAPNVLSGVAAGLGGIGMRDLANGYQGQAREIRRKSRVSGDPRVRGQAETPKGMSQIDDLLSKGKWFGKAGRLLSGPVGFGIDIGFGIKEGHDSGDWTRAGLTTTASIAAGTLVVMSAPVSVPAAAVVVTAGVVAYGASELTGYVYDHRDDIADAASDVWDGAGDLASGAKDKASDAWDKVTPW